MMGEKLLVEKSGIFYQKKIKLKLQYSFEFS